ncbi:MAG TPA: RNA-binding domain-containing protein [Acidobacteriota bacterium]|nr:RNA-binding domain-containing protein [Acidobacteriota bacterium]
MDWVDILERIESGEDDRTEFKRGLGDLKATGRTLAAFANSRGGVVIFGVDDTCEIVGVKEDPEKVAERLTAFLTTGLSAPVQARLQRHEAPHGWVHWVEVPSQRGFEPLRHEGRVYVRRGRSSVEPSPSELQDLYNLFGYILTEERAIEAAGVNQIDISAFRKYLARLGLDLNDDPQPSLEEDLLNRGVVARAGDRLAATLYGILAFGREPQYYPQTSNFWVECVAYAGTDRSGEVLQVGQAQGRIDEQVERALGWLRSLGKKEHYKGIYREDRPLLPVKAAREALVNAVVHRDYAITGSKILFESFDDRIVVTSPGSLPNTMTPSSVRAGGHPRSRNELLANFMLTMGFMEQRGRGWPVLRRAMMEHNGTEPDLQADRDARFVRVTFWLDPPTDD